jgi:two-component system, cell cycle sensor histidine kinase and response regulator CckA
VPLAALPAPIWSAILATNHESLNPEAKSLSFLASPAPMWVFDRETLAFLDVNEVAIRNYGFSRQEFLSMTILDIRPLEDVKLLLRNTLDERYAGPSSREAWRHRRKDGTVFDVEITSWELDFNGRPAEIVVATEREAEKQGDNQPHLVI